MSTRSTAWREAEEDDVFIGLTLKKAGVMLVSVSEHIDETPSGKLLHGIMATMAEFYSRNLASEVVKGTTQKVKAGHGCASSALRVWLR